MQALDGLRLVLFLISIVFDSGCLNRLLTAIPDRMFSLDAPVCGGCRIDLALWCCSDSIKVVWKKFSMS